MVNVEALGGELSSPAIWAAHGSIQVESVDVATIASEALIKDAKAWDGEDQPYVEEVEDDEDIPDMEDDEDPELDDLDYMAWGIASRR
jgi:hypothetical protein